MTAITECWYDHVPPAEVEMEARDLSYTIDEKTPRGVGGWTILYNFRAVTPGLPSPQWFTDVCTLCEDYEDFYFEKMEDVVDMFDSLSTTARNKADTLAIHEDIYDLIAEIDEEYFDTAEACADLIPATNWLSYNGSSQR